MYWFAFLLYVLLSSILGLPVRKRSWKWLFLVHILSACIALAGTMALIDMGQQYAADAGQLEEVGLNQAIVDELE